MEICIVGTGYVGLVTGACFAEKNNNVLCVDINEDKIKKLKLAVLPIYEPGLQEIVEKNINEGRLTFTNDIKSGIENALFCFICVGTPASDDGSADLSYVFNVARGIGQYMNRSLIIVEKSTVPVGTAEKVREIIKHELTLRGREDIDFDVVSNPEFLKEGMAVKDFLQPDRIVIGTENKGTNELMKKLYQPFVYSQDTILTMNIKSAEITKYAANTMLATRISFMNEIAKLCDKVGADIENIRIGIGSDERIGSQFLYAGAGYGGSCFPKDVQELISTGKKNGLEMAIATAVHKVNEQQKKYLVDMIKQRFGEKLQGMKFGIWGLAFKSQTDDIREAPAIVIIQSLVNMGATILAYDPEAMDQAKQAWGNDGLNIQYVDSMLAAVVDVDALLLITDWPQFKQADFNEINKLIKQPVVFDGRNQFEPFNMAKLGFEYYSIGRICYVN